MEVRLQLLLQWPCCVQVVTSTSQNLHRACILYLFSFICSTGKIPSAGGDREIKHRRNISISDCIRVHHNGQFYYQSQTTPSVSQGYLKFAQLEDHSSNMPGAIGVLSSPGFPQLLLTSMEVKVLCARKDWAQFEFHLHKRRKLHLPLFLIQGWANMQYVATLFWAAWQRRMT